MTNSVHNVMKLLICSIFPFILHGAAEPINMLSTALIALQSDQLAYVQSLIVLNKSIINTKEKKSNRTLLSIAIEKHKPVDFIQWLVAQGAAPHPHTTLLHEAAAAGHHDLVIWLLEHGTAVNNTNQSLDTPLHTAVIFNKPDCVRTLLARGAAVNARNSDFDTPLHLARLSMNPEIAFLLLLRHPDVSLRNKTGYTASEEYLKFHCTVFYRAIIKVFDRASIAFPAESCPLCQKNSVLTFWGLCAHRLCERCKKSGLRAKRLCPKCSQPGIAGYN